MSTRAIITVENAEEKWSLYCHGDGYPSYLGRRVKDFTKLAQKIDVNSQQHFGKKGKESRMTHSPYAYMANVSSEPSKFIAVLAGWLMQKGYGGAYLTTRDPFYEAQKFGSTDIEWYYHIRLYPMKWGKTSMVTQSPKLTVFEYNWKTRKFVKRAKVNYNRG